MADPTRPKWFNGSVLGVRILRDLELLGNAKLPSHDLVDFQSSDSGATNCQGRRHLMGDVAANARSSSGVRHPKTDVIRRVVKYARMRSSFILSVKAWSSTFRAF